MLGKKFTILNSNKQFVVIEKHKSFKDTWRCYPIEEDPPYEQSLIKCFGTDFIQDCLKQEDTFDYDNYKPKTI